MVHTDLALNDHKPTPIRRLLTLAAIFASLWFAACSDRNAEPVTETPAAPVVVFAASSMTTALDQINALWQQSGKPEALISYAASSALAQQIENGAPADIYVSADLAWMDYLQQRSLIDIPTRLELLGNRLALVAPANTTTQVAIVPGFPLATLLGNSNERLAIADTTAVPAGRYGRAALEFLGVWDSVANRLAPTENVRAALLLVSRGEAPLGIVYQTDAAADPNVRVAGLFPTDSHPPIIYPVAITTASENPDAQAFLDFLLSPNAREVFEGQGFSVLVPPR